MAVTEAKRSTEAQSSVTQCYAQMLAAARLNWELGNQQPQETFGCYTIADTWTFIRAEIEGIDTDMPSHAS